MDLSVAQAILHSFSLIPELDTRSKVGPQAFVVALVTAASSSESFRSIAALRRYFLAELGAGFSRELRARSFAEPETLGQLDKNTPARWRK